MDKATRRVLDAALEGAELEGELFHDELGPAVYRLEPTPMTVAVCGACHYVGLIPTIPMKPRLTWTCGGCGRGYDLAPPARIWVEGSRPQVVH